jgi:hypothetical protein
MKIQTFFIALALVFPGKLLHASAPETIPEQYWDMFDLDDSIKSKESEFAKICHDLFSLPSGHALIESLHGRLQGKKIKVRLGRKTGMQPSKFTLDINFGDLSNSVPCLGPKVTFESNPRYQIGTCTNHPYLTLGHEFVHALHYLSQEDFPLENSFKSEGLGYLSLWGGILNRKSTFRLDRDKEIRRLKAEENATITNEDDLESDVITYKIDAGFMEVSGKQPLIQEVSDYHLWNNSREQRAVIGAENNWNNQFTEFNLRAEAGLLPRYGYHDAAQNFYEDPTMIEYILQSHFGVNWEERFDELLRGDNSHYTFDPVVAERSRFTQLSN